MKHYYCYQTVSFPLYWLSKESDYSACADTQIALYIENYTIFLAFEIGFQIPKVNKIM